MSGTPPLETVAIGLEAVPRKKYVTTRRHADHFLWSRCSVDFRPAASRKMTSPHFGTIKGMSSHPDFEEGVKRLKVLAHPHPATHRRVPAGRIPDRR